MVWLSFAWGVGLCYLVGLHVGLYVGSGLWLFWMPCGLGLSRWFAFWHLVDFCIGLMPLLLCYRGGAVRFSFSLGALASCICILLVCGALPFWK